MAVSPTSNSSNSTNDYSKSNTVKNDELTTNDFMMLMLQQLKLQDPTKPYDAQQMLTTQMQMSTLSSNLSMVNAMDAIKQAFEQTSITNVANLVGRLIENGDVDANGAQKGFQVVSVENYDGKLVVIAREFDYQYNGLQRTIKGEDGKEDKVVVANYDPEGNIYDENGKKTGETIELESPGKPKTDKDGNLIIKDADGKLVEFHEYEISKQNTYFIYKDEEVQIPFEDIKKVY